MHLPTRLDIDPDPRDDSVHSLNDSQGFSSLPRSFIHSRIDTSPYEAYTPATVRQSTRIDAESSSQIAKLTKELGRLQNEVSFLKGVLGNEEQTEGPVYLIPAELFYMLKGALFSSFTTIEQHLNLMGDGNHALANRLRNLRAKANSAVKAHIAITPDLMTELMECLTDSEALQSDIYAYYCSSVEKIAQDGTHLLSESLKVLRPLAEKSSKFEDEADMSIWNERRTALANEVPSLLLISLQRNLLQDFETMKQRLLGQELGIRELMTVEKPGYSTPMGKKSGKLDSRPTRFPSSPSIGEDLRFSLKTAFANLFESLNATKAEVGKWSWQDSPLRSRFSPKVESLADVEVAVKVVKHDIEEIAKVVTAERQAIEQRIDKLRVEKVLEELRAEMDVLRKERESVVQEKAEIQTVAEVLQLQVTELAGNCYKYESALIEESEKAKLVDRLRGDNSHLAQQIASLKSSHEHESAHQSAILTRINAICGLPESSSLEDLEAILRELKHFYADEEEAVMEVWEQPIALKYRQCKFLTTYANNEANLLTALRYLIDKTEELMKAVDEDYQYVEGKATMPLHELERREFALLDEIGEKFGDLLMKLIDKNSELQATLETDNQHNQHLQTTISHLQSHLATNELTINFNSADTDEVLAAPSKLYTDITIEERLAKGLALIAKKVAEMAKCEDPIPEDSIEAQKFVYDLLERVGEDVKRTEETAEELRNTQSSLAESQQSRADLERQVQEGQKSLEDLDVAAQTWETALMEKLETSRAAFQAKTEQLSAKIIKSLSDSQAKLQEMEGVKARLSEKEAENQVLSGLLTELQGTWESTQQSWEAALMEKLEGSKAAVTTKIEQLSGKVIQLLSESKAKSQEIETLQATLAEKEAERQALSEAQGQAEEAGKLQEQLAAVEAAKQQISEELEGLKEASQVLQDQLTTRTMEQEQSLTTIAELEAAKVDLSAENATLLAENATLSAKIVALTSEITNLNAQLSITEVQISFTSLASEETRPPKYGCSLEEKLVKGFDLAMRKCAEALGKPPSFADTLLEQQMQLLENVDQLCVQKRELLESVDQLSVQIEGLRKTKRAEDQIVREALGGNASQLMTKIDLFKEQMNAALTVLKGRLENGRRGKAALFREVSMDTFLPGSKVSQALAKELDEMLMRTARAVNRIPIYPPMLVDKVACLGDFIAEFSRSVRQGSRELRDEGLTYKILHGSNELLENRLSL